jgi:GT2 family glycosyltransferase
MDRLFGHGGEPSAGSAVPSGGTLPADLRVEPGPALQQKDLPPCAVVVLNLDGKHHLDRCFGSLSDSNYPPERMSTVLIENGSSDGSAAYMRQKHSWVHLVENEINVGFAAGCNQGAAEVQDAEVLVFLNNDMRVEPDFLRELVAPIARGECAATTGRMYSWDGKEMNSAGGGMNFHGIGIQRGYGDEPGPAYDVPRLSLFACGGAMAMEAALYRKMGGFDEEFFAYYEDVDLGWRTWVLGHSVQYVPGAICYHHHSSTSKRLPKEMVRLLQVRNPILACVKNYDDENLRRTLPAILALATRRMYLSSGIEDDAPFRLEKASARRAGTVGRLWDRARAGSGGTIPIDRIAAADLIGLNDLLGRWDHWMDRRREVQSQRARPDSEIFRLFLKPLWCVEEDEPYARLQAGLEDLFGLDEIFAGLTTIPGKPHK